MAKTETRVAEHSIVAQAPAQLAFDLLADVARWPQYFSPIVHTEHEKADGAAAEQDRVTVWALRGEDTIRTWTSRRTLDRQNLRIEFVNEASGAGGAWTFTESGDGVEITVRHEVDAAVADEVAKHSVRQLEELAAAAEHAGELEELIVDFEDPLFVAGSAEDAYRILYEADKWPERLPHVAELTMTEDEPNIQFFDMVSVSPDGRTHLTRSVRVCLPHDKIVYKQISLPPLLDAHTGHWSFTAAPEGIIVGARHTATIKRSALHLLGEGTTVADARRYLRRVLGNNSMTNLRLAKDFAEKKALGE